MTDTITAYVNCDDGNPALHCGACDQFLRYIEAGDDLDGLISAAQTHACAIGETA